MYHRLFCIIWTRGLISSSIQLKYTFAFACLLQQNPWTTFRVGLFCGIFMILVVVAIVSGKCCVKFSIKTLAYTLMVISHADCFFLMLQLYTRAKLTWRTGLLHCVCTGVSSSSSYSCSSLVSTHMDGGHQGSTMSSSLNWIRAIISPTMSYSRYSVCKLLLLC